MRLYHPVLCCLFAWAALLLAARFGRLPAQEALPAALPGPTVEKARLLPGKYTAAEPALAVDTERRVVIAAIEHTKLTRDKPRATAIMLWRSEDSGRSWLSPFYLHESREFGTHQADPWLQAVGPAKFSIVYLAASSERPDLPSAVFQRSEDGGKTWTKPHAFHRWVDKTVLAVSPSCKELAVTFTAFDPDQGSNVQVHRSRDQGKTWQQLSATFPMKKDTYIAQGMVVNDDGAIAIGWTVQSGTNVRRLLHVLTTTTNGGKDWTQTEITAMPYDRLSELHYTGPALAVDGAGRAHAVSVRLEEGKGKLDVLLRSTKDFQTWSDPVVLASGPEAEFRGFPAIAASGSRIHVAWMERKDKKYHVWYRGSADNGKSWSERFLLSRPEHPSELLTADGFKETPGHYMSLADDGKGVVHAVWGVGPPVSMPARAEIWHNAVRWSSDAKEKRKP